jgi:hypothetical protein
MHPYMQSLPQQPSIRHRRIFIRAMAVLAFIVALIIAASFHIV